MELDNNVATEIGFVTPPQRYHPCEVHVYFKIICVCVLRWCDCVCVPVYDKKVVVKYLWLQRYMCR